MPGRYLLALDEGTSSCRSIVFDPDGGMKAVAQTEFTQHFPRPGLVEHDATEIWEKQLGTAREAIAKAGIDASEIAEGLEKFSAEELAPLVRRGNREYWQEQRPSMPDPLYDLLVEQLRRLQPDAPVLEDLGEPAPRPRSHIITQHISTFSMRSGEPRRATLALSSSLGRADVRCRLGRAGAAASTCSGAAVGAAGP